MAIQTATISQLNPVDNIELGDKIEIERNGTSAHTTLNSVLTRIANLETSEGNNKGQFDTPLQLQTAYPTPTQGWYAYINSTTSQWRVNISNEWYDTEQDIKDNVYSKQQVDEFLNTKVDKLTLTEEVQDIMSTTLVDTPTVDFVYDDENNNITANIKDNSVANIHVANNANIETSKIKQTTFAPINDLPSNGDSQNVVNNKIIGKINNLQDQIYARPVGASNGEIYYFTSQASTIPNYEYITFSPDSGNLDVESIIITNSTAKNDRLIGRYISQFEIGNSIINGGNWLFNLYGYASNLDNATYFEIDILKRAGTVETLLFTANTTNFTQTSQINPILNLVQIEKTEQTFSCNPTDYIVIKIYGKTDNTVSTTITLLHSGTDYASHIHTPLVLKHNNLTGIEGDGTKHISSGQLTILQSLQNLLSDKVMITDNLLQPKTSDITVDELNHLAGIEENIQTALNNKQNATDNALTTTNKNVVGAINELKSGKNVKIWYVSGGVNGTGNDNNNGYNQNNAFASLAKLNTVLGNTGEQVVLLPSQLTENATFIQQNIEITGSHASHRGVCGTTGTITSNHSASSQTYSYFSCGSFVKQNAYVRLHDLSITNSFSDSGSGVIDAYNVLFNATTPISITGSGNKNFYNQRGGIFAINNASALVNVITNDFISQFTLTAGLLFIKNAIVYIAQGTTFTIGTSGATFIAEGVKFMYPDNTVAKINIPTGVNYSMQNGCIYDIANSTLNGTNVASLYKGYFDNVILNTVNLKNSTASTLIATDSNKNIQSLSTGTYPSLQELSYVKGLTSSVQDQLNAKESVITNGTTSQYFRGDKTFQTLDKIAVGLSNVDNTSDSNKPISNATQTALDLKENAFIKNNAFNKNFGNTAGTVCEGNDARLSTNLSVANQTATQLTIVSDTGNDATLTSATTTVAGLLSATDKTKLDSTSNVNTGDETGATIYTKFKDQILSGTNVSIITDDANKTITINSTGGGGSGGSGTDTIGSVKVFHQSFIPDTTWQPTGATYNSATYPIMADKLAGRTVQPVQETSTNEYFPNGASDRALYFPHIFYAESDTGVILYLDGSGNGAILTNNANNTDLVYQSYNFRSKSGNRGNASTVAWVKDSTTGIGYFVTQIWDNADNSTLRITEADLLAGLNWTNLGSNRPGTIGVLRSDKNNTLIYTPMGYKTGAYRSINAGTSWTPITYPYQPVNTTSCTSNLMAPVHNGTVWFIVFPGTFNSATSVDGLTWTGRNNLQFVQQFDGSGSVQWTYFWHTTLFTGGINNKNFYFTPQPNDYCNYNYFYQYSFYSVNDGVNVRLCTNPGTPHQGWYGNGFMAISNVAGNSDKVYYSSDMSSNWLSQTFANTYFGGTGAFIYSSKYKKAYTSTYKFSISYSLNTTFTVPSHNISLNTTNYAALIKMG